MYLTFVIGYSIRHKQSTILLSKPDQKYFQHHPHRSAPRMPRVYIHAIFRPHWWGWRMPRYLSGKMPQPARNICSKVLKVSNSKEVYMPDSGTMDYVLIFEPLMSETQTIHFLNPTDPEGNIMTYRLVLKKKILPLATIKCNWFKTDGSGSMEYGATDSISILNNRIYINENIRKKEKWIEMTLKIERVRGKTYHSPAKTACVRFSRKEAKN